MYPQIEEKKHLATTWFKELRDSICAAFIELESTMGSDSHFQRKGWERSGGGGGEMSLLVGGKVFEKVGVNISTVHGQFSEKFAAEIPGAIENQRQFWASGISLVAHPLSPWVPAVHMNTRLIVTSRAWFGGGADLTPCLPDEESAAQFHNGMQDACATYDPHCYPGFKKQCDEYFFLPHRNEPRGIGGIFYDYLNCGDWERDFNLTKAVGTHFRETYTAIARQRMQRPWTTEEKAIQLTKRGRYVEFNLLYDRGTKFGLMTDGNVEAILMSLPPLVAW